MAANRPPVPLPEVKDLMAPGEPLPFRVLDAYGRMLLAAGQRVMDLRQLQALLERGACVEYDDVQAERARRATAAASGGSRPPSARRRTVFDRWEQQVWALDALLRSLGKSIDQSVALQTFADEHTALVDRQADAALFVCIRQDDRRFALYGLTHALHTATVALFCARQLGWPPEHQRVLVCAALTMNLSMLELQARMAEQSEPPSKKQLDEIRSHTTRSAQTLRDSGVQDELWLQVVTDHHEQPGGGGYPRGLQQVGDLARLLRVCDVFMAKISPRAIRSAMLPQMAARELFQSEGGGPLAAALIKSLGVHPPGDFVRLKSGELAVVVQRTESSAAPIVAVLADATGKPVHGAPRRETRHAAWAITGVAALPPRAPRVHPEQVYGLLDG